MYIDSVKINNFRGLSLEIFDLKDNFVVIGKNDSGKSNLCYAIRKVLDFNIRKKNFGINDSTNGNCQPISIELRINLCDIDNVKRSKIAKYIHKVNDFQYVCARLSANYNSDTMHYDEVLSVGDVDSEDFATNVSNPLDKIIQLIYINPSYDFEKSQSLFFKYKNSLSIENSEESSLTSSVKDSVEKLNNDIRQHSEIKQIGSQIKSQDENNQVFDEISFDVISNLSVANIYNSLKIIPVMGNNEEMVIGDGKTKILSMLLQKMSYDESKSKIFIVEEPENHLYPLLQLQYSSYLDGFNMSQTIITTHSPYLLDFSKMKQIIRLNSITTTPNKAIIREGLYKEYGSLFNEDFASMLYYNIVVLVEGFSEKYFYNLLKVTDTKFRDLLIKKHIGIFCVGSIDFKPAKELLEQLGIIVYIKTDNDFYGVKNSDTKMQFAGIKRCFDCLRAESKEALRNVLGVSSDSTFDKKFFNVENDDENCRLIKSKMQNITELFYSDKIILSNHYDGFEGDLLNYLQISGEDYEKQKAYLQKSKLKNLHSFIQDFLVNLEITDSNKSNPLIKFLFDGD